jgi:hypothetical protein
MPAVLVEAFELVVCVAAPAEVLVLVPELFSVGPVAAVVLESVDALLALVVEATPADFDERITLPLATAPAVIVTGM